MADNSKGATGSSGATGATTGSAAAPAPPPVPPKPPVAHPEGHGAVGTREAQFTSLLPNDHTPYDVKFLFDLAKMMKAGPDTVKDGPDPEENLWVPAGYTYFGQFVDHDLTFDSTSSLNPSDTSDTSKIPTNLRTPRFDLDCVYGDGPDAQPFMYADDGATLLLGGSGQSWNGIPSADFELLRSSNGRAIIGDKRNDENSIVNQIQQGFIKTHNAVVAILKQIPPEFWIVEGDLFRSARYEVRWTYQRLVLEDFLPRIVAKDAFADLATAATIADRAKKYVLYKDEGNPNIRSNLPREFVVAAYRFGHSGVRTGYRLNKTTRFSIFPGSNVAPGSSSLLGFDPLPKSHVIDDWGRFFPDTGPGTFPIEKRVKADDESVRPMPVTLQFAYKLDPTLVDPLGALPISVAGQGTTDEAAAQGPLPDAPRPSLALLNLLRGNQYAIRNGQAFAKAIGVAPLDAKYLVIRQPVNGPNTQGPLFQFKPIDQALQKDTPLWFYILAEAQAPLVDALGNKPFSENEMLNGPGAKTQLRQVGGRIVAEVFYGLMDSDDASFLNSRYKVRWTTPIIKAGTLRAFLEFSAKTPDVALPKNKPPKVP